MQFSLKPDYDKSLERYKAFWEREIVDRALVAGIQFPIAQPKALPQKKYSSFEKQWLDIDFRAEAEDIRLSNVEYYADSLPIVFPNMGPEIFSAWCGCGYDYSETTTWAIPCVEDWETDAKKVSLSFEHPLFKATEKLTRALLERGKGKFIVGLTDFHPGGDHLAALRDPANLAMDLLDNPDEVKKELVKSQREYFVAYEYFYKILREAGMPITSWLKLIYDGKFYIPSNDFSCMISTDMFQEFFLPGIIEECQYYDKSIYHLDGPGALRHLDTLLDIKELDAIQWVPGAGNEGFEKWIHIYKKIQKAKKGMHIFDIHVNDLALLFENLRPEGVFLDGIRGIPDKETADSVLKRIISWK